MEEKTANDEQKLEKVISGKAKKKKPNLGDIFTTEDIGNVKYYLFQDVLIPNIKKLIHDIVTNGIDMFLYRDGNGGRGSKSSISRPSYRKYYDDGRKESRSDRSEPRNRFGYSDVIVDNRGEAEDILGTLEDACEKYDGFVTVGALYDLAGIDHKYTDYDYGWTRPMLREAKIIREREGYLIKMPRPVPID